MKRGSTKARNSSRGRSAPTLLHSLQITDTHHRWSARLFTAAAVDNDGPSPDRALSLLSARVSVKWKRVSGTMAARQKARLPPARMLNGGARGACHRVNNGAWTGGWAVPQQQHRLGGPEVRSELEGSII